VITSRDNKWLKTFRAALRGGETEPQAHGNGLAEGGLLGLEGPKLVEEALRAGLEAEALLVSESGEHAAARILRAASESEAGIPQTRVFRTTDKLFAGIAGTESPQGVAALFRQRHYGLEDVLRGAAGVSAAKQPAPLVVVLAEVQDPGNVGTILRSAEAFGATGAVTSRGTADPWSPKALRASAGSALRLPVMRCMAIPILLAQLRVSGLKIYATTSRMAEKRRTHATPQADLTEACAIFVGNEGAGLSEEIERAADALITIPTSEVESLNAGVAASIVLYEAARQRRQQLQG
jgi:RNA methyltransferase, TrmH family